MVFMPFLFVSNKNLELVGDLKPLKPKVFAKMNWF
jgi:hypothetical protein